MWVNALATHAWILLEKENGVLEIFLWLLNAHWHAHTHIQPHTSLHSSNNKHLWSQDSLGFFFCWFAYPDIYVSRANNCSFTFTIWQGLPCGFSASIIRKLTDTVVFIVIITFRNGYPLQWESLYGSAM